MINLLIREYHLSFAEVGALTMFQVDYLMRDLIDWNKPPKDVKDMTAEEKIRYYRAQGKIK